MTLFLKIAAAALLLTTVALSARQGWAMLAQQPAPTALLRQLHVGQPGQLALGATVLLGAGLTLLLATFWAGSFLSAAAILLILTLQVRQQNLVGAALEVPFLLLALLMLYLGHPLAPR